MRPARILIHFRACHCASAKLEYHHAHTEHQLVRGPQAEGASLVPRQHIELFNARAMAAG